MATAAPIRLRRTGSRQGQHVVSSLAHDECGIGSLAVEELSIRKANALDSDFAFAVKEAAFRGYVEQVWGLGPYPSKGTT